MFNCLWGRFLVAPAPNRPKVSGWFFGRENRLPVFLVDPDWWVFEPFDLFLRVGFDFFPFLVFPLLRLGCDVVFNMFGFRTALGRLVVVDLLRRDDFDPMDWNLDFFDAGFDVTESLPKLPKLDLLFGLVAWKLFGPLFELDGFLKPNVCPLGLGWLLLLGLLLFPVFPSLLPPDFGLRLELVCLTSVSFAVFPDGGGTSPPFLMLSICSAVSSTLSLSSSSPFSLASSLSACLLAFFSATSMFRS